MTEAPLVSVIVPNYNHAAFLRERIDSILKQTFQNFELILLDDCSTDTSVAILNEYASHPKVARVEMNERNSGSPFAQWKKGFRFAQGSFVWIAESDDAAAPELLQTLISPLQQHPECVLAHCNSMQIDSQGGELGLRPNRSIPNQIVDGKTEIFERMRYWNSVPNASGAVFRRAAVTDAMIPDSMRYCGDCVFWIRLLEKGSVYFESNTLNYTRVHQNTNQHQHDSKKEFARLQEHFDVINEAIKVSGTADLERAPYLYLFHLWRNARFNSLQFWRFPQTDRKILHLMYRDECMAVPRTIADYYRRICNRICRTKESST
ncbi:glycosyltransferase family 2 protein [Novipirellula sp. SH528]|uniref:glycosyltransferase family 2 protein n=1 Tax=Novipirellula sp. SH528 TaxID=3454466 RepID=UPI003FA0B63C